MQLGLAVPTAGTVPVAAPGGPVPMPAPVNIGGVMAMRGLQATLAQDAARAPQAPRDAAQEQVVTNLAGHIRRHWRLAYDAKRDVEQHMLSAVRARRGEYDPKTLSRIEADGGSAIYMMLFATKARQAKALLTDVFIGSGDDKPWSLSPSPQPELPDEDVARIIKSVATIVMQAEQAAQQTGQPGMAVDQIAGLMKDARDRAEAQVQELARMEAERAEADVEDILDEGGWTEALDEFLDDITTFKTAFVKGPVVRQVPQLKWVSGANGASTAQVQMVRKRMWERVDPFNAYPAPWAKSVNDAYFIERHQLERGELSSLIGVDGYNEAEIRKVLDQFGSSGLHQWLSIDTEKAQAEGRNTLIASAQSDLIDALQYWGSVSGKMLIEWGMDKAKVPDPAKEYQVEAWLIGEYVIKAVINQDPLGRRPYYGDGYSRIPGAFWHNSLFDVVRDCQDMCNAAARALANNMGIASGPQVDINVERLAAGETITKMYPWKIWQTTSDPMGSTAKAINFFNPDSHAQELMAIYEKFSTMADEYSGIPRYMTGVDATGGAGRTASGMSMMIGNAGKMIKQLIGSIDMRVVSPSVARVYEQEIQYNANMRGDLNIVARGALSLQIKESAQQRRVDFLGRTANQFDMQIMGVEGRAAVLREVAKSLDMATDDVVPSPAMLRLKNVQQLLQQAQQGGPDGGPQGAPGAPGGPGGEPMQRDPSQEQLQNGQPVTDNFSPTPH